MTNLIAWADSTSLSIGNRTSVAENKSELKKLNIEEPLILGENIDELAFELHDNLYCVGFNVLQIPIFVIKCGFK